MSDPIYYEHVTTHFNSRLNADVLFQFSLIIRHGTDNNCKLCFNYL